MKKPYMIAEMGVNFYDTAKALGISALDAAKMYIDKAAEAGSIALSSSLIKHQPLFQRILLHIGIQQKNPLRLSMNCFKSMMVLEKRNTKYFVIIHMKKVWILHLHLLIMLLLIIYMTW